MEISKYSSGYGKADIYQSFIYDNLEPKKSNSKTYSAAKAMAEKTAKKRAEMKHAERKSEAKETADKRQEAIVEKLDLEKEQLKEIWEEKQTSIQTYSNSGDDMVKEVEPSGSQFNFTA